MVERAFVKSYDVGKYGQTMSPVGKVLGKTAQQLFTSRQEVVSKFFMDVLSVVKPVLIKTRL